MFKKLFTFIPIIILAFGLNAAYAEQSLENFRYTGPDSDIYSEIKGKINGSEKTFARFEQDEAGSVYYHRDGSSLYRIDVAENNLSRGRIDLITNQGSASESVAWSQYASISGSTASGSGSGTVTPTEEEQVNAMNGLTKFFIKIILIFAAGFVPIIMGDKLAAGIQGAVDKFSRRARDNAYKTSKWGSYQEGKAKAKMQNAATKYNINRGKLSWRNPIASTKYQVGKAVEKSSIGKTRAGAMLSSRLTDDMQTRIGIGWEESEKRRSSRPYMKNQSMNQLRHANFEKRRDAILDLSSRGDMDFLHEAFDPTAKNHELAQSVLRDISVGIGGRGDGEMFASLKDNNPDALIAASLHTMRDSGTRAAITRSGGKVGGEDGTEVTLMKQGQAAMYSMQPDKYNKWASASLGNVATLSSVAQGMAQNSAYSDDQGKLQEIGGYFNRYFEPTRAEYQVYSRDIGQKGGRNAIFEVDKTSGELKGIKPQIDRQISEETRATLQYAIDNQHNPAAYPTDLVRPDGYDPVGDFRRQREAQERAMWEQRDSQRTQHDAHAPGSYNSEDTPRSWNSNQNRGSRDNRPRR